MTTQKFSITEYVVVGLYTSGGKPVPAIVSRPFATRDEAEAWMQMSWADVPLAVSEYKIEGEFPSDLTTTR